MTGLGSNDCDTEGQVVAHRVETWWEDPAERWRENWVREGGQGSPETCRGTEWRDGTLGARRQVKGGILCFLRQEVLRGRH